MNLGFSTGVFYNSSVNPISNGTIETMLNLGCNAIEISCLGGEFGHVKKIDKNLLSHFSFISLHAPAGNFIYKNDKNTVDALNEIKKIHSMLNLKCIVIHPSNVENWDVFKNFMQLPICIENMDNRKEVGKTFEDIDSIKQKTGLGVMIDLQHCFSNDHTMKLAEKFLNSYGGEIKEFHVSGFFDNYHHPLFITKQKEILGCVPADSTVIIESPVKSIYDMKKEYAYIKSYFDRQYLEKSKHTYRKNNSLKRSVRRML